MGYILTGEVPKIIEVERNTMRKLNTLMDWIDDDPDVWEYLKRCKYKYDEKKRIGIKKKK